MAQQLAELDYEDDLEIQGGEYYSPEQEREIKVFAKDFSADVKALARQYVEQFFSNKMLHCGGKIPKSLLFSERRMSMVLNYDIVKGVQRAYKHLEPTLSFSNAKMLRQAGEATDDIKLVNEVFDLLAKSGIPQQFAGGILCLYLEFIEGVDIGTEP